MCTPNRAAANPTGFDLGQSPSFRFAGFHRDYGRRLRFCSAVETFVCDFRWFQLLECPCCGDDPFAMRANRIDLRVMKAVNEPDM